MTETICVYTSIPLKHSFISCFVFKVSPSWLSLRRFWLSCTGFLLFVLPNLQIIWFSKLFPITQRIKIVARMCIQTALFSQCAVSISIVEPHSVFILFLQSIGCAIQSMTLFILLSCIHCTGRTILIKWEKKQNKTSQKMVYLFRFEDRFRLSNKLYLMLKH